MNTAPASKPRNSNTRKINTDVVRIMVELGELVRNHDNADLSTPPLMEKMAGRIREERFVERALLVSYLTLALPDTAETRDALEKVFGGEHRRSPASVPGSDSGVTP